MGRTEKRAMIEEMERLCGRGGDEVTRGLGVKPKPRVERIGEMRGYQLGGAGSDSPYARTRVVLDGLSELRHTVLALAAELEGLSMGDEEAVGKRADALMGSVDALNELVKAAGFALCSSFLNRTAPSQARREPWMNHDSLGLSVFPLALLGQVAQVEALLGKVVPQVQAEPLVYSEVDAEKLADAAKGFAAKARGLVGKIEDGITGLSGGK